VRGVLAEFFPQLSLSSRQASEPARTAAFPRTVVDDSADRVLRGLLSLIERKRILRSLVRDRSLLYAQHIKVHRAEFFGNLQVEPRRDRGEAQGQLPFAADPVDQDQEPESHVGSRQAVASAH
jgi:hypothetical protein